MDSRSSEVVLNTKNSIANRIIGAGLILLAVILYFNKTGIGWSVAALVLGIGAMTFGSRVLMTNCPNCNHKILKVQELENYFECPHCETYLKKAGDGKKIELVDENFIATEHVFKWVLPWNGFNLPGVSEAYGVTGGIILKTEDTKQLDAKWPPDCCLCGSAADHWESISKKFRVTPGNKSGIRSPVDKEVNVFVTGIPHCRHHTGGAVLKVAKNGYGDTNGFLAFRSLWYYRMFKQLNKQ